MYDCKIEKKKLITANRIKAVNNTKNINNTGDDIILFTIEKKKKNYHILKYLPHIM